MGAHRREDQLVPLEEPLRDVREDRVARGLDDVPHALRDVVRLAGQVHALLEHDDEVGHRVAVEVVEDPKRVDQEVQERAYHI